MECPVYQLCPISLWPHWASCSNSQENLFPWGISKAVVPAPDVWDTTGFWFVFIYVSMCFFMPIFFFITRHSPLWTCLSKTKMLQWGSPATECILSKRSECPSCPSILWRSVYIIWIFFSGPSLLTEIDFAWLRAISTKPCQHLLLPSWNGEWCCILH